MKIFPIAECSECGYLIYDKNLKTYFCTEVEIEIIDIGEIHLDCKLEEMKCQE